MRVSVPFKLAVSNSVPRLDTNLPLKSWKLPRIRKKIRENVGKLLFKAMLEKP